MTLEHVLPQSLGGAFSPDFLKTRRVCRQCNGNLGLFVDAGFTKSWFVTNWLQGMARDCYDPKSPSALPLVCLGNSGLTPPGMGECEISELYLGPRGDLVFWIRPNDERLYWYTGGNPRTTKEKTSRAYFFFSERSAPDPMPAWLSFKEVFSGRKVKKIMATALEGADPTSIGFSSQDELDTARIGYFLEAIRQNRQKPAFR